MGSKSKNSGKQRLSDIQLERLSRQLDLKLMQMTQQFTQALSVLSAKVEVLEKVAITKLRVDSQQDLNELFFDRLDELNGIVKSDEALQNDDRVRIAFKQAEEGDDITVSSPPETTILIIGKNQVHANLDSALLGKRTGDTFKAVLPALEAGGKTINVIGEVRAVYPMNRKPEAAKQA